MLSKLTTMLTFKFLYFSLLNSKVFYQGQNQTPLEIQLPISNINILYDTEFFLTSVSF